jgi:hypothetical protein
MGGVSDCCDPNPYSYGQYPIPVNPSMPGQPNFVVPPPVNRQTGPYNPATVRGSLVDTVTGLSTPAIGPGGLAGYGVGGGVYGPPGVYGARPGFY